nr:ABC transporter permease [Luteibacter yeojuensis]
MRTGRALVRRPGFLLLGSATLSLGVAAMVGTFTLLDSIVLQSPPWPNHERVVVYGGRTEGDAMRAISPRLYAAVGLPPSVVSHGIARMPETVNAVGGAHREMLHAQRIDAGFLPTLGIVPREAVPTAASGEGLFISHALWRRWFHAKTAAVGSTLVVDGQPMTVLGVLPADYRFFSDIDLLILFDPATMAADTAENMTAVGLLTTSGDEAAFSADVVRAARRDAAGLGLRGEDLHWYGATRADALVARGAHDSLWLFAACALLVLVVAGVNVSHLMSVRMFERIDETALRMVLGATGTRTWVPALTEAAVVGAIACVAGLPLGTLLAGRFVDFLPPAWSVSGLPPTPGWRVFLVVVLAAQAAALLATASGATSISKPLLRREQSAMRGSAGVGRTVRRARTYLLLAEVAVATVLLSLCVAAVSRACRLARTPPGFDSANAVVVEMHPPARDYPGASDVLRLAESVRVGVTLLAGVDSVGWSTQLPTGQAFRMPFLHADGSSEFLEYALVTPGGNPAMGLRKLAGRWFGADDDRRAGRVAIVNEAYLHRFASDGVGDVVRPAGDAGPSARIVGVVEDTLRDGSGVARPAVFVPFAQADARHFALVRELAPIYAVIRGPAAAAVAQDDLPRIVERIDPSLVVSAPVPLRRIARAPVAMASRNAILFATLSLFAVSLAVIGQYSAQAADVAAGRDLIALRSAFGASPANQRKRVLRQALYVALMGTGLGSPATYLLQRWLCKEAEWPGGIGIGVTVIAACLMGVAVVAAAVVPARRAGAVEPWRVLRSE